MPTAIKPASNADRRPQELTGRKVLIWFVSFFAVVGAVNAVMVRAALTTFGGVETESSYKAGLVFAKDIADARAQDSRRWQVKAQVSPVKDGAAVVNVSVRDAADKPVPGLDAIVQLDHPTDRRLDHILVMHEQTPGDFRGMTKVTAGQRELVIDLTRGGERLFRSKNRIMLH